MFSITNTLTPDLAKYWVDNKFSSGLISANTQVSQAGYSMHLSYPSQDNKDPLNIAELLMPDGDQLGVHLIKNYGNVYNTTTKIDKKLANWLNLVHILLDNTVCYFEAPSTKYRTKLIVTRNLHLANALSSKPIANFDLLYKIISGDMSYLDNLAIAQPQLSEIVNNTKSVIVNLNGSSAQQKQALEWLSQTFNCDINLIKAYIQGYTMITQDINTNCLQGKCGLIKLKYSNGYCEMPARIQAATSVPVASILVPLDFMLQQAKVIVANLKSNLVFARFTRENNITRDLLSTHNQAVLEKIYDSEIAKAYIEPTVYIDKGYISCVDLCSSKIGGDLLRAISLPRLLGISFISPDMANLSTQLQPYGWHPSFPDTDFNQVISEFKNYIAQMRGNMPFLTMLYTSLTNQGTATFTSPYQVEESLYSYVDLQANLTSSFIKKLHLFMLANPLIFQGYTGKPKDLSGVSISTTPKFKSLGTI